MSSEHLWVYGTLRPSCVNPHAALLHRGARHVGRARVQGRLYRIDWYPGMRLGGEVEDWVVGDLFELLDPSVIPALDEYEGSNEYQRVRAEARLESGESVECWVYEFIGEVSEPARIGSGDWLAGS